MVSKRLSLTLFLACLAIYYFMACNAAIDAPTIHIDGAFQTASGLFRLKHGHLPGRDFFPYLGIGPLFFLFPLFTIFGSHLSASVIAAKLLALIVGGFASAVVCHLVLKPSSFIYSLALGNSLYLFPLLLGSFFPDLPAYLHYNYGYSFEAGNSLKPLRASAPYLVTLWFYFVGRNISSARKSFFLNGLVAGLLLLWSNDFAFPTLVGFSLLVLAQAYRSTKLSWQGFAIYSIVAFIAGAVVLSVATGGHPLAFIEYNFLSVARDQWWYFPPYAPAWRVLNLGDIFNLIDFFPFAVVTVVALVAAITRRAEYGILLVLGQMEWGGGILASVGGHIEPDYFYAVYYWSLLSLVYLQIHLCIIWLKSFNISERLFEKRSSSVSPHFVPALMLILIGVVVGWQAHLYYRNHQLARQDARRLFVPELGGYLGQEWKSYIEAARASKDKIVLEEYWGLWSAVRSLVPPWPVDSVIHALGATRAVAAQAILQADMVITTRHAFTPHWQAWSLSQNFWFYRPLFEQWSPQELSPHTVVWKKENSSRAETPIACSFDESSQTLKIRSLKSGFYSIAIEYAFASKGRALLFARNNLSSVGWGYVSLDPEGRKAEFPVYVAGKGEQFFDFKSISSTGTHRLALYSCEAQQIALENNAILALPM